MPVLDDLSRPLLHVSYRVRQGYISIVFTHYLKVSTSPPVSGGDFHRASCIYRNLKLKSFAPASNELLQVGQADFIYSTSGPEHATKKELATVADTF
jgi:hypothetical protein